MISEAQGSAVCEVAGETLILLPGKAVYWPAERTLFVADLHLGKAAAFRALAVPVPTGATMDTLTRLSSVISDVQPLRLCILGDLWHAQAGMTEGALEQFSSWRNAHSALDVWLVDGNHDRKCLPLPVHQRVLDVSNGEPLGPFRLFHEPQAASDGYGLAGHLHPGARLVGRAEQSLVLPCFWFGESCAVLPAFGAFTGYGRIRAKAGDSVFVIAGDSVIRV